MKKIILITMMFIIMACSMAFAEASFDQIQQFIKNKEYSAAINGLDLIIKNHPQSAKAYYAMAQAQAGVGNQVLAKKALDMAKGIDPTLKFASNGNVEKLTEAIQPQTKKIEAIESHKLRNTLIFLVFMFGGIGAIIYFRKKDKSIVSKPEYLGKPDYSDIIKKREYKTDSYIKQEPKPFKRSDSTEQYYNNQQSYVPPPPVQNTTVINNSSSNIASGAVGFAAGIAATKLYEHVTEPKYEQKNEFHNDSIYNEQVTNSFYDESKVTKVDSSWDDNSSKYSSSWDDSSSSSSSSSSWSDSNSSSSSWDSSSSSSDSSSSSSWD